MSRPGSGPARELAAGPLTLVAFRGDEGEDLTRLVAENLEHLRPWMPWLHEPLSAGAQGAFVRRSVEEWAQGSSFDYWMREEEGGEMVGCASLRARAGAGTLEIGYWVSATRVRRGYATASARALTRAALALPGVAHVEIRCDAANVASTRVARRLGYRLARVDDRPIEAPGESGSQLVWVTDAATWPGTTIASPADGETTPPLTSSS